MAKRVAVSERKRRFLDAVGRGCVVADAATYAGIVRSTVYLWAERDPVFKAAWVAAELASLVEIRSKAFELAKGGNIRLIMWLLERYEVKDGPQEVVDGGGGVVEIVGLKEGESGAGPFIEFR